MIYSYTRHINGFAAMLEEEEAADIAGENDTPKQKYHSEMKFHPLLTKLLVCV